MTATDPTLDAIARPSGTFAMVAMDQRESLRQMFQAAGIASAPDNVLVDFKMAVAEHLGPVASGFLIDRHFGADEVRRRRLLPPGTGLIIAADELTHSDQGTVEDTALDATVLAPAFDLSGVSALKLLLIWRNDGRDEDRIELARAFIAAARDRGLLSVLEPVVRAAPGHEGFDREFEIHRAARALSPLGPSLYKVQVPLGGRGTEDELEAACRQLAAEISGPWVVLSQGVDREDFHGAVLAACRAGASGFLAGRALWSDLVGRDDLAAGLREIAVPRLERLIETVDAHGRPWSQA